MEAGIWVKCEDMLMWRTWGSGGNVWKQDWLRNEETYGVMFLEKIAIS